VDQFDYYFVPGAAVRPDGSPSGTLQRRVESAWKAASADRHARILVSGGQGRYGPPEAAVMSRLLQEMGAPAERIVVEPEGRNTLDSVIRSSRILRGRGDARLIYICTSDYHQLRCRRLLQILGFATAVVRMPPERTFLGSRKYLYYWLREFAALPWDALHLWWLIWQSGGRT
jgi:vancomycin permeability regulator SanA